MLHPKHDRIDYGEQLIPPPGYELVRAIGTTYSLELEALMVLPVALFYSQLMDGTSDDLRFDMLDSITKAASKITVFCQNGKIKIPKRYHNLMAYWEEGICEVTMPTFASSFHPKVWVIRYESAGEPAIYRVIVMSRNLTFARDWDVAFSTQGVVGKTAVNDNLSMVQFLQYLNKFTARKVKTQGISKDFLDDLINVQFDIPAHFSSLEFHPIGISTKTDKGSNQFKLNSESWDDLLAISPFVDETTINLLKAKTKNRFHLLAREEEMDCVPLEALKGVDCWQFSRTLRDAELLEQLSESGIDVSSQDIHAKMYIAKKGNRSQWYMGSANCSNPAFTGRNVEFMISLSSTRRGLDPEGILDSLTNKTSNASFPLFEGYTPLPSMPDSEFKSMEQYVRKLIFDISKLNFQGIANKREDASVYDLKISVDTSKLEIKERYSILLKPLQEQKLLPELLSYGTPQVIEKFKGYPESTLSAFLGIEIQHAEFPSKSFLVRMEIELPESRLSKIFTTLIDSNDKFLRYLQFLLGNEANDLINRNITPHQHKNTSEESAWNLENYSIPVFEKLLVAASRYPDKLKAVERLIARIEEESEGNIITPEFKAFWQIFRTFLRKSIRYEN
jgi:HKD family nuclease